MAWMEMDLQLINFRPKLFKLFPRFFMQKINSNGRGILSVCELRLYLPLDVQI